MSRKYDIENLLDGIKDLLVSKLNTKMTEIDGLKNDGLTMRQVNSLAYAFQGMNEKVMNFNPYIVYGVESIDTIESIGGSAIDVTSSVVLVLSESGVANIDRLMIRYSRALKEVIEENYQSVGKGIKMTVNQFMPISFKLNSDDTVYKAVGININATIP